MIKRKKGTKFNNKKIIFHDIKFDSEDEMYYYQYLLAKKAKEEIIKFELQPKYLLQPKFIDAQGKTVQAITYTPDYLVYHLDGTVEAIDVKSLGTATQQGELRKKMFLFIYPQTKLTWICRNLKRSRIDGQWIKYEDLKAEMAKEARAKKKAKDLAEAEENII